MQSSTSLRLEIQKIKSLPPMPMVAQKLLSEINNELASINQLSAIIRPDPGLTSKMLGLANSAFFGFGRRIYTLEEAIINVLGLDLVRGLALTMAMGGAFNLKKCTEFDITRYWSSALLTAELAMRVSSLQKHSSTPINTNKYYLYGLLHNFGILVLVDCFPKLMEEIFQVAKKDPDRRLVETEQAILDIDHHQAGAWLGRKWQLPDDITTVIEHHHYPDYRGEYWREALLVGFCSRATRNWIMQRDILIPDEKNLLSLLQIDHAATYKVAEKCHSRLEEFYTTAEQMA